MQEASTFLSENASHEISYWLALKFIPRLNTRLKLKLVESYGLKALFKLSHQVLAEHGLSAVQQQAIISPDWQRIKMLIHQCKQQKVGLISYDSDRYPAKLKHIASPPLILFTKGNVSLLHYDQIAIVGSRATTFYGRENAQQLAKDLAQAGYLITSGLALGADSFAHKGCLSVKGKTIAVLATGIDVIYPARHRQLAQDILEQGGLLITEALPGTQAFAGLFPKRNRLISGLSLGVVVVEAAIKSGSLVTAKYALEQGREVFAFPGPIQNPQSAGCHQLIKQGAKLIESWADVVEELSGQQSLLSAENIEAEKKAGQDLCDDPLLDSVGYETTPVDLVVSRSKLPADVVLTRLTILELRGLVSAVPGGYLRKNGS